MQQTIDLVRIQAILHKWISQIAPPEALEWLDDKVARISEGAEDWVFFTSFSAVPRYTGKADLKLDKAALDEAGTLRPGWNPASWSVDQAARTLLLLALPSDPEAQYIERMEKVFNAADVGESVVLYQSLPLYPHPEKFVSRAAEGLRSNMTSVFDAVALNNPFPSEHFEENAWNQLVLKSCFVGSTLHRIVGIDTQANAMLASILSDYAHERWAAGRELTPELWRPVGPFATDEYLSDLERVLNDTDPVQQQAGALALSQSPAAGAKDLLASRPDLQSRIEAGELTWDSLSKDYLS